MPLEYYLGGAVALIVLVLLVMALTGKKSTRRVVVAKSTDNEELTRQVARAADAIEALLTHLKAHPVQPPMPVQQAPARSSASGRAVEAPVPATPVVTVEKASEPQVNPQPVYSQDVTPEPAAEPQTVEPAATTEAEAAAATTEQKPRRVKLSMFGR